MLICLLVYTDKIEQQIIVVMLINVKVLYQSIRPIAISHVVYWATIINYVFWCTFLSLFICISPCKQCKMRERLYSTTTTALICTLLQLLHSYVHSEYSTPLQLLHSYAHWFYSTTTTTLICTLWMSFPSHYASLLGAQALRPPT